MNSYLVALATALWILGAAGIIFVKRRAFYRRNGAGLEQFSGYGNMLLTVMFERVVSIAALLCLCTGTMVMFMAAR